MEEVQSKCPDLSMAMVHVTGTWLWLSKPMGSHFGWILEPILVGIGMFTWVWDFDPWPFGVTSSKFRRKSAALTKYSMSSWGSKQEITPALVQCLELHSS